VTAHQSEVVVEVPKDLIHCEHPESSTGNDEEKVIALEIARASALGTFPAVDEQTGVVDDAGSPIWHEERPHVMNERPCDHERNGIRAWRIAGVPANECRVQSLKVHQVAGRFRLRQAKTVLMKEFQGTNGKTLSGSTLSGGTARYRTIEAEKTIEF